MKKNKILVAVAIIICFLIAGGIFLAHFYSKSIDKVAKAIIENDTLIFRYDDDFTLLSQIDNEENLNILIQDTQEYVKVIPSVDLLFRSEPINSDLYIVGSIYVPNDIKYEELKYIIELLIKIGHNRYLSNSNIALDDILIKGEDEDDLANIDFKDYEFYEYTKKASIYEYYAENDSIVLEDVIIEKINIFFY